MKKIIENLWIVVGFITCFLVIWGFFYFEASLLLRIMIILFALAGLVAVKTSPEIFLLLIFYLGLYDLYNIRYGLALPLALILAGVFGFSLLIFYLEARLNKILACLDKNIFLFYLLLVGLMVLEIFLVMTFWPVDPKIKSLVIVIVFYLTSKIFYLYANSVINLKKIVVLIGVSILILAVVIAFNLWFGF